MLAVLKVELYIWFTPFSPNTRENLLTRPYLSVEWSNKHILISSSIDRNIPNPNLLKSICKHFSSPMLRQSSLSSGRCNSSIPPVNLSIPSSSFREDLNSRLLQHTNKCLSSGWNSAARVFTSAVREDPSCVRVKVKKGTTSADEDEEDFRDLR